MLILLLGMIAMSQGDVCPEGQKACASGMTCCLLPSGGQGCCPYANATCCADRVHCCPKGSRCVEGLGGHCSSQAAVLDTFTSPAHIKHKTHMKRLTNSASVSVSNENCGNGIQCPDGDTCCLMSRGEYGCCPMPNAVCCADELHCCPQGSLCDAGGFCKNSGKPINYKWPMKRKAVGTVCPGGSAQCPAEATCCAVGQGEWGCCPMPNAVCCSDMSHCCPSGYQCRDGQCLKKKHIFLP